MTISSFDDLLRSVREPAEPLRLLFVFAAAGLPDDATPEQRARVQAGQGGTLTPLMCVDKAPGELASFDALVVESRQPGPAWDIVFVAAMAAGPNGDETAGDQAEVSLQRMVDSVRTGAIDHLIPFDVSGLPLQFD